MATDPALTRHVDSTANPAPADVDAGTPAPDPTAATFDDLPDQTLIEPHAASPTDPGNVLVPLARMLIGLAAGMSAEHLGGEGN